MNDKPIRGPKHTDNCLAKSATICYCREDKDALLRELVEWVQREHLTFRYHDTKANPCKTCNLLRRAQAAISGSTSEPKETK